MSLHQKDLDETKSAIIVHLHLNKIPIGEPGAPVIAWGLCIIALVSAVLAFLELRFGWALAWSLG